MMNSSKWGCLNCFEILPLQVRANTLPNLILGVQLVAVFEKRETWKELVQL